ncbi:MAG: sugar O-acetyltransferase [Clostridia bacterium]|nr:sugar O-acetyltransferase [Clostridia bacterium]
MTDSAFLEQMRTGEPVRPDSEQAEELEKLSWRARWLTNYLNCVPHRPPIVRRILSELTGRDVPEDVDVWTPVYVQIGLGLSFGRRVRIEQGVHLLDLGGISLGDGVCIGCGSIIMTSLPGVHLPDRNIIYPAPVNVEKDVWIGPGVTIMPGVTIGAGAVISPGSLVAEDVGAATVAAGRPARYVRDI